MSLNSLLIIGFRLKALVGNIHIQNDYNQLSVKLNQLPIKYLTQSLSKVKVKGLYTCEF